MTPVQIALAAFEILLLIAGAILLGRTALVPDLRERWLRTSRIPRWPVEALEFLLFIFVVLNVALFAQAGARALLGTALADSADRQGLEVIGYGLAFHGSSLLCWFVFWAWRRARPTAAGAPDEPPPSPPPASTPISPVVRTALVGFLAVIPVLSATSVGWTTLLRALGLPDERQDLIDIFAQAHSPLVVAGIAVLAIVIAPLNEELLFRAGIYRFTRDRTSRVWALLLSSVFFASLHANLASFVPLVLLGIALALVYEKSGSLASPVILHALFNLNTTLIILSGLPDLSP